MKTGARESCQNVRIAMARLATRAVRNTFVADAIIILKNVNLSTNSSVAIQGLGLQRIWHRAIVLSIRTTSILSGGNGQPITTSIQHDSPSPTRVKNHFVLKERHLGVAFQSLPCPLSNTKNIFAETVDYHPGTEIVARDVVQPSLIQMPVCGFGAGCYRKNPEHFTHVSW